MVNEKKTFVDWIKEHRKELLIAGVSIAAIIGIIVGIKNHEALDDAWASLKRMIEKTPKTIPTQVDLLPVAEDNYLKEIAETKVHTIERIPHSVSEHIRNLPEGWNASVNKIATATDHGYVLLPGQTWVEAYRTGGMVA